MSVKSSFARVLVAGVAVAALATLGTLPAHAAGVPGDDAFLDTAIAFTVIGGAAVTNTGPSVLDASLAVSPGSATTGFPPGLYGGELHSNDAVAIQAQLDVTTAANAIMALPSYDVGSADLDGLVFQAGAYSSASSLMNNGTITLNGDADDVFIFTAVSTLTTGSGSTILFTGGAQECNVFWRVGSSATLGTGSHFAGTLIAQAAVTANTLATINGRLFAQVEAVTLQSNVFTAPTCDETAGDGSSEGVDGEGTDDTPPSDVGPTGPVLPIPDDDDGTDDGDGGTDGTDDGDDDGTEGGGGTGEDGGGTATPAEVPSLAATGSATDSGLLFVGLGTLMLGGVLVAVGTRRRRAIR